MTAVLRIHHVEPAKKDVALGRTLHDQKLNRVHIQTRGGPLRRVACETASATVHVTLRHWATIWIVLTQM